MRHLETFTRWTLSLLLAVALSSCWSGPEVERLESTTPSVDPASVQLRGPKRRVAVARFTHKNVYGGNLFGLDADLGTQAADILASHLIKAGQLTVVERRDLAVLEEETDLTGREKDFAHVEALILGSVVEYGFKVEAQDYGFQKRKQQIHHCKVTIRMVDPVTGEAFFSAEGQADAKKEVRESFGFGDKAGYDATLGDKALNGAVAKLVGNILVSLRDRPWKGRILEVQESQVIVNAGNRAGLKPGDRLVVEGPGRPLKDPQSGVTLTVPGEVIGEIEVLRTFGESALSEGSICKVVSGTGIQPQCIVYFRGE